MEEEYKQRKREAFEFGKLAEEMTAMEYIKRGYTILERRFKVGKVEVDLIAQKDDIIVIIEVKARNTTEEDALAKVTAEKRRRLVRAADNYLRGLQGNYYYRFDISACTGNINNFTIDIIEDAFVGADIY